MISALADVMVLRGVLEHLRSDNGPAFVAKGLCKWLAATGAKTLYIEPGSPWENGYCESFNSEFADYLVEIVALYPDATTIHPVLDSLNTHGRKSLVARYGESFGSLL